MTSLECLRTAQNTHSGTGPKSGGQVNSTFSLDSVRGSGHTPQSSDGNHGSPDDCSSDVGRKWTPMNNQKHHIRTHHNHQAAVGAMKLIKRIVHIVNSEINLDA